MTLPLVGQATSFQILVVLVAALVAAVIDVWKFKVHNMLTLPLLASGVAFHGVVDGWVGVGDSLLGMAIGFLVLIFFYLLGGMGAGDVKLMAAIGAWLGLPWIFYVFLASSLAAGVYALVVIVISGRLRETWINLCVLWHRVAAVGRHLGAEDSVEEEIGRSDRRSRVIPFAAMMAIGLAGLLLWARFAQH